MSAPDAAASLEDAPPRALPRIDYGAHPAYGGMFEPAKWLRRHAQATLEPILEEVRRGDRERLSAFGRARGQGTGISRELAAQGFSLRQLEPRALEPLSRAAAPLVRIIRARLDELAAAGLPLSFKAAQEVVDRAVHPELWTLAEDAMREAGLFEAAMDYAGAPGAKLKSAAVMVNRPGQAWCTDIFRGGDFETPPTVGFHIDSVVFSGLKLVLYLNDVDADQGPFGVIPASHLWEPESDGRAIRRAFDRWPYLSRGPNERRALVSLPPELQLKAEFGGDMPPEAPETLDLVAREHVATGPRGQLNAFVPEAIHRGGITRAGERQVMLLSIAARRAVVRAPERGAGEP